MRRHLLLGASGLRVSCLVLLLASVHRSPARPDTEAPRVTLGPWTGNLWNGPKANAVGQNLSGSEFVNQDLREAVFDECDLRAVRFHQCDLTKASFRKASLSGASIEDCTLDAADFTDATISNMRDSFLALSERQLMSTRSYRVKDLRKCEISAPYPRMGHEPPQYDLRSAKLDEAQLIGGDLTKCDFSDASINAAVFRGCRIRFSQLASTHSLKKWRRIQGACFENVHFTDEVGFDRVTFLNTLFVHCWSTPGRPLPTSAFADCTIARCFFFRTITKEGLCATKSYKTGDLTGLRLKAIDLSGCDFSAVNLTQARFLGCDLTGALLRDAVITNAQFAVEGRPDCKGLTLEQIRSTWNYKHNRMGGVMLPKSLADELEAEKNAKKEAPR